MFIADWVVDKLGGNADPGLAAIQYVRQGGHGPFDSPVPDDYPWRW
jgi:hypothetical protein